MPAPAWITRSLLFNPVQEYGECVKLSLQIDELYGCRSGNVPFELTREWGRKAALVAALAMIRAYMNSKGEGDDVLA